MRRKARVLHYAQRPEAQEVQVYLDGEEVLKAIFADEVLGIVLVWKTGEDGQAIRFIHRYEFAELRYGKVEIRSVGVDK